MTHHIIGTMEPFDLTKGDWQAYSERLEQFFVANGVEGDKRVATFVTVIGTETYSLLRTVVAPATPATKSYEDLVAALKAHLNPKPITIANSTVGTNKKVKQLVFIWQN